MTTPSPQPAVTPTWLDAFRVHVEASLRDAIAHIENNSTGFLIVMDHGDQVLVVLADGDVRRALLSGHLNSHHSTR